MMPHKGFSYRLYPNKKQEELLAKTFGCTRFIYNYFLDKRQVLYRETGKGLTFFQSNKQLTEMKQKIPWLKEPDKNALQCSLINLDKAYQNFFRQVREGKKGKAVGFPNFKSKHNNKQSYTTAITNGNIAVFDNTIKLPKLGLVKAVIHRPIEGCIKSATIKKMPSGKYFVSVLCEIPEPEKLVRLDTVIGIDVGLETFVTLSTGEKINLPASLKNIDKKIAKANRNLNRKKLGSKNRQKARVKLAVVYEKATNQRNDFQHKVSMKLIHENQVIGLETLSIRGMMNKKMHRGHNFGRNGLASFIQKLGYKADWYGRDLIYADRFFASSQICSVCGFKNSAVKDCKVRKWECPQCKTQHDRDINASENLKKEALKYTAGTAGIYACGDMTSTFWPITERQAVSMKQEALSHG